MSFLTHSGLVSFFSKAGLLSPRPSTTLVQLEIAIFYFLELLLWVDVEGSLKNSTSHFLSFLKQDTEQENVAQTSRVTAYEMCVPQLRLKFESKTLLWLNHFDFPAGYISTSVITQIPLSLKCRKNKVYY